MNRYITRLLAGTLLVTLYSTAALAHDPSAHQSEATKPDCSAMQGMDSANMDAKDPVMQAMQMQCAAGTTAQGHHGGEEMSSSKAMHSGDHHGNAGAGDNAHQDSH